MSSSKDIYWILILLKSDGRGNVDADCGNFSLIYHLKLNQLYEAISFSVRKVFAEGVHRTYFIKIIPLGSGRASEDTFTILRYIFICVKFYPKKERVITLVYQSHKMDVINNHKTKGMEVKQTIGLCHIGYANYKNAGSIIHLKGWPHFSHFIKQDRPLIWYNQCG